MKRPRVALIGAGRMGSNHARVIHESEHAELNIVIDNNRTAAETLANHHQVRVGHEIADALRADAVVIAASSASHLECARPVLEAGIPVLVEKPLAMTLSDVDTLVDLATCSGTPLMCGLVERYSAAITTALEQLGDRRPTHLLTVRHSPPAAHIASSVVADLLLHDLDTALRFFKTDHAKLHGATVLRPPHSDFDEVVDCTLSLAGGMASLSASRMGQRKVRTMNVYAEDVLLEIDLLRQTVTKYRNVSQEMMALGAGYRSSTEIEIPFVRHHGEPLALQFAHFLQIVDGRADAAEELSGVRPPHVLMAAIDELGSRMGRKCED